MKVAILFLVAIAAAVAEEYYTSKYDSIDIDAILESDRLLQVYIKCLMETGKCNEEGKILKEVIPDALMTSCKKCTELQKARTEKVIRFLVKNKRSDWDALIAKYDPDMKYRKNYEKYYKEM